LYPDNSAAHPNGIHFEDFSNFPISVRPLPHTLEHKGFRAVYLQAVNASTHCTVWVMLHDVEEFTEGLRRNFYVLVPKIEVLGVNLYSLFCKAVPRCVHWYAKGVEHNSVEVH
ncbi:MAG: hypothetical protein QUS09_02770, partial [Methanotrichaceae archaeon]|nr:hypothetical protein [Methanotrichaceae archaeon]